MCNLQISLCLVQSDGVEKHKQEVLPMYTNVLVIFVSARLHRFLVPSSKKIFAVHCKNSLLKNKLNIRLF